MIIGMLHMLSEGKLFRRFFHNFMGWHLPKDECGFDGCSFTSTCKICNKKILQDSQGNWFVCKKVYH